MNEIQFNYYYFILERNINSYHDVDVAKSINDLVEDFVESPKDTLFYPKNIFNDFDTKEYILVNDDVVIQIIVDKSESMTLKKYFLDDVHLIELRSCSKYFNLEMKPQFGDKITLDAEKDRDGGHYRLHFNDLIKKIFKML